MLHENLLKEEKMLISNGFKDGRKVGKREGMQEGLKEGIKEGIKKGILEGKIEGITEIIKNMLKIGEKEEKIQKYTGMPIEQIRKLKKEIKV